jgi:hypothetical protein
MRGCPARCYRQINVLERVLGGRRIEPLHITERIEPFDLFLADQFLLSRMVDVDEFEVLEAVKLAA